jgi:hypothetical protein
MVSLIGVNDFKIGIIKSIKFPTVYKDKNNSLLKKLKQWNEQAKKKEIDFTSTNVILRVVVFTRKEKLLIKSLLFMMNSCENQPSFRTRRK